MVNVWQKKNSGNLFGYVRHVEEWLFDGWNFVIPTDVGILCYWQRCRPDSYRGKFSMTTVANKKGRKPNDSRPIVADAVRHVPTPHYFNFSNICCICASSFSTFASSASFSAFSASFSAFSSFTASISTGVILV